MTGDEDEPLDLDQFEDPPWVQPKEKKEVFTVTLDD